MRREVLRVRLAALEAESRKLTIQPNVKKKPMISDTNHETNRVKRNKLLT